MVTQLFFFFLATVSCVLGHTVKKCHLYIDALVETECDFYISGNEPYLEQIMHI